MDKDLQRVIDETLGEYFVGEKIDILSGEEKYSKQEPGGQMSAVNCNESTQVTDYKGWKIYHYVNPEQWMATLPALPPHFTPRLPVLRGKSEEEIKQQIDSLPSALNEAAFRIYNETLCPDLWDDCQHLDPRVRVNLLRAAYDFYKKTKFQAPILDVWLMGSIANYNWTPESDADVHIIINFSDLKMPPETASKVAKAAGASWNKEHNIFVKGHKVEINIQSVKAEKPYVMGIYSLVKDEWVRQPSKLNVNINKPLIQQKFGEMKKYVEFALQSGNREEMKKAKDFLDDYRQYGLDTGGELSTENIVYKILRSKGLVKQLKDAITATYDKEMTVNEMETYRTQMSDDEVFRDAERYFSIGHDDPDEPGFTNATGYVWIWDGNKIVAKRGTTHGAAFSHDVSDRMFKGRFDPSKNAISVVFPDYELRKLGDKKPTVDDIPQRLFLKLISKFKVQNPRFEVFESETPSAEQKKDYIGSIVDGEVRAEPVKAGKVKFYMHNDFPGLISGMNSTNWRYKSDKNQVLWNTQPTDESVEQVNVYLAKRGIVSPSHKNMYTYQQEITQKQIPMVHPGLPEWDKEKKDYIMSKLTLSHLRSLIAKEKSFIKAAHKREELMPYVPQMEAKLKLYVDEFKRRLKYINNPVMEGTDRDYDAAVDFHERRDRELEDLARLLKQSHGKGKVPWKTIPASLLKRVWLQFGKYKRIKENDLDKIADQILTNIARLQASTEMMGHTSNDVRPELADNGYEFSDQEWEDWMTNYFTDEGGNWLLSDYGLEPLKHIYVDIFKAETPEEKLYACDKALNVIHQRSDLAALFVEGGSATLSAVANQGGYTAPDDVKEGFGWVHAKDRKKDPLHIPGERWRIKWYSKRKTPKMKEEE